MNKKRGALFLSFIAFILFSTNVSSHNLSAMGSESAGWIYVGSHWPGRTTYYFDSTSDTWLQRFKNGESKFESESGYKFNLYQQSSTLTENYVDDYGCSSCSWVARRGFYSIDSDHPSRWRIQFNNTKTANSWTTVAAHEIGHIYGLDDVYESYNSGRLMFGVDTGTRYLNTIEKNALETIY